MQSLDEDVYDARERKGPYPFPFARLLRKPVPLPFNSSLAWRIWDAKRMAEQTDDPRVWLEQIGELERLSEENGHAAERLVELLVSHKSAEIAMIERQVEAVSAGHLPPKQPLSMLLSLLVVIAHHALVRLGHPAQEALLRAYAAEPPGSEKRYWFLLPLADMGVPELASFFESLKESDFGPAEAPYLLEGLRQRYEASRAGKGQGQDVATLAGATEFDQMLSALEHENEYLRIRAAHALGQLGDPRAIEPLKKRLKDRSEYVRKAAEAALERIRG